jgi:hypothetical protein
MCQDKKISRVLSIEKIIASAASNPNQEYQFNQQSTWVNKRVIGAFIRLQSSDTDYSTSGVELITNTAAAKGSLVLKDGSGTFLARIPLKHLSVDSNGCCGYVPFSADLIGCVDMNKSAYQFPTDINTLVGTALNKSVEVHFVYDQL